MLGIVVIGRNEAPRLGPALAALRAHAADTVYVDSGSTDGSPGIAEQAGVTVVRLTSGPYTAARGRQIGLETLLARCPALTYVQFVDGDCILDAVWLATGRAFLDAHPDVGVVVGRLREQHAARSLLIRLVDVDWDLPTGDIDAIGGIALMRVAALRVVGSWRVDLVAGEELDLGTRLRAAGWRLVRLPAEMTLHDIGIRRFGELWRRSVRSGFAYTELAVLHGQVNRRWRRRVLSQLAYGGVLPLVIAAAAVCYWPLAVLLALAYPLLAVRVAGHRRRRGDAPGLAALYGLLTIVYKFAGALGTLRYALTRWRGRDRRLMEYKAPQAVET
jgi:GT2 family glycosyltransferase